MQNTKSIGCFYEYLPSRRAILASSSACIFAGACVPDGPRITATVCYRAPVGEVYAQFYAANVFWTQRDGMVSFCGPQIDPMQPLTPARKPDGSDMLAHARTETDCCASF